MAERIDLSHSSAFNVVVKIYNEFASKEGRTTPTKLLKELSSWMLHHFSEGREVSFPTLGTFHTKKESRKMPDGRGETKVVETWVVRFRPSSGFKARLNITMNRLNR